MNRTRWALIAFGAAFLAVGVPFWQIPYNKGNLPDALIGPGLVVVAARALGLAWRHTSEPCRSN